MTSDGFGAAKGKKVRTVTGNLACLEPSRSGGGGGGNVAGNHREYRSFGRGASFVGRPSHSQHSAWATIAVQVDATVELMELRLKV